MGRVPLFEVNEIHCCLFRGPVSFARLPLPLLVAMMLRSRHVLSPGLTSLPEARAVFCAQPGDRVPLIGESYFGAWQLEPKHGTWVFERNISAMTTVELDHLSKDSL